MPPFPRDEATSPGGLTVWPHSRHKFSYVNRGERGTEDFPQSCGNVQHFCISRGGKGREFQFRASNFEINPVLLPKTRKILAAFASCAAIGARHEHSGRAVRRTGFPQALLSGRTRRVGTPSGQKGRPQELPPREIMSVPTQPERETDDPGAARWKPAQVMACTGLP